MGRKSLINGGVFFQSVDRPAVVGDGGLAVFDDLLVEGDQGVRKGTAAAAGVKQLVELGIQILDLIRVFAGLFFTFNIEAL